MSVRQQLTRIGIFGGTFDPPHIGHLILCEEALYQLTLNRVLWVLTPDPPHKQGLLITPLEKRLRMVQAALRGNPSFELSHLDIDRPPPHYAVDSMRILHGLFPDAQLVYLMGGDSLQDLPTWHDPIQFVACCDLIGVMCRPGQAPDLEMLEQQIPGIRDKVRFVDAPLLEIASSEIRQRVASGEPYRYYLPARVFQFIERENLYRTD